MYPELSDDDASIKNCKHATIPGMAGSAHSDCIPATSNAGMQSSTTPVPTLLQTAETRPAPLGRLKRLEQKLARSSNTVKML